MQNVIEFKTPRVEQEFKGVNIDPRLRIIIWALAGYTSLSFNKGILLTEIYRTQAEQDEIYKDDAGYRNFKWDSVHQYWRGADVRLTTFTLNEAQSIADWLNNNFVYTGHHPTALNHDVGSGWHLHIQVDTDGETEITGRPV